MTIDICPNNGTLGQSKLLNHLLNDCDQLPQMNSFFYNGYCRGKHYEEVCSFEMQIMKWLLHKGSFGTACPVISSVFFSSSHYSGVADWLNTLIHKCFPLIFAFLKPYDWFCWLHLVYIVVPCLWSHSAYMWIMNHLSLINISQNY